MKKTLEIEGTLVEFEPEDNKNPKFVKRVAVVNINEQPVPFVFTNEAIQYTKGIVEGDIVHVTFSLRGWNFKGKNYSSLEGLSITKLN